MPSVIWAIISIVMIIYALICFSAIRAIQQSLREVVKSMRGGAVSSSSGS